MTIDLHSSVVLFEVPASTHLPHPYPDLHSSVVLFEVACSISVDVKSSLFTF